MNLVMKIFLSMSFSGALLILVLSGAERLLKDTISRKWQYYIWLIVILRLLLPFGSEISLMGKAYQTVDQITARTASFSELSDPYSAQENVPVSGLGMLDRLFSTVHRSAGCGYFRKRFFVYHSA